MAQDDDDADPPSPTQSAPVEPDPVERRPAVEYKMIERTPTAGATRDRASGGRSAKVAREPRVVAASGAPVLPRPARTVATRRDAAEVADTGWLKRLRHRRPARHPA
jgi:hypothetical protein